ETAEGALVNVLREADARASLVFCATREEVRRLHAALLARRFSAVALSGELSQQERNAALQALRDGRARVCVATDVAARGLDLPDLGLVVHADLPIDGAVLLHRSGRTGRAGRKGVSVVLVPASRRRRAEHLFATAGVAVEWRAPPAAAEIRRLDQARLAEDAILSEPATAEELGLAGALLAGRTPTDVAVALIRLHRAGLPVAEDIAAPAMPPAGRRPPAETAWFRINVGRRRNADPKWLLPLLCRIGDVTRAEIGAIRIFAEDSRFEVAQEAAARFGAAACAAAEDGIAIEPASPVRPDRTHAPRPMRTQARRAARTDPSQAVPKGKRAKR
ncbi:MAG TPA: C-terminal helicase domain-containing protein, partial [Acetobacteraceae bacterium]|nr:C-terminal helicase domain-containing protein [Acetobacteraceae bacterium]